MKKRKNPWLPYTGLPWLSLISPLLVWHTGSFVNMIMIIINNKDFITPVILLSMKISGGRRSKCSPPWQQRRLSSYSKWERSGSICGKAYTSVIGAIVEPYHETTLYLAWDVQANSKIIDGLFLRLTRWPLLFERKHNKNLVKQSILPAPYRQHFVNRKAPHPRPM